MIYYSNAPLTVPHMTFIGRWSPFHKGHITIITKKIQDNPNAPVLILVRHTDNDAYHASTRAEYIKIWMKENHIRGTIMIIPNVEGVYWGRSVGYNVGSVDVDLETSKISGTRIRHMSEKGKLWKKLVGNNPASYLLSKNVTAIMDRGLVVWLTGQPASGKTTIATSLKKAITTRYPHLKIQLLDGDVMRASPLGHSAGFSPKDRAKHIIRMAHLAKMFADLGILTICAFVSPNETIRKRARTMIGEKRFIEVYVKTSKATRMRRDPKGMYKMASQGEMKNFTGYNAPYQSPKHPKIVCDTDIQSVAQCVSSIASIIFHPHT